MRGCIRAGTPRRRAPAHVRMPGKNGLIGMLLNESRSAADATSFLQRFFGATASTTYERACSTASGAGARDSLLALIEDQTLVRRGLRALLDLTGDMAIVAEAADGEEGARVIRRERPDVVLLDVRMPGKNGIDLLTELRRTDELPPTILLTTFDDDEALLDGIRAGARGCHPGRTRRSVRSVALRTLRTPDHEARHQLLTAGDHATPGRPGGRRADSHEARGKVEAPLVRGRPAEGHHGALADLNR